MTEFELKYGVNPNQKPARIFMPNGGEMPIVIENGRPGYINFLDALNSWQLVKELKEATGLPSAASFKHVSPAGAAIGLELSPELKDSYFTGNADLSPLACAYARARGADRLCSYGDWAALSDVCDEDTATMIASEVSDGVIAPGYTAAALEILRRKRGGAYNIVSIDPTYEPSALEYKDVSGVRFEQLRNTVKLDETLLLQRIVTNAKDLPEDAQRDLLISLITLKYTQSNSVCFVKDGQAVGIGAGQQSRVHCVRLAGSKADIWHLRLHPKVRSLPWKSGVSRPVRDNAIDTYVGNEPSIVTADGPWQELFKSRPATLTAAEKAEWLASMDGFSLGSDAFFPFDDNIERARRSGVKYVAQPGGSIRDDLVIKACDDYGMVMSFTGVRLFHH